MSQDKGPSSASSLPDALAGLQRPSGSPERLYGRSNDFSRAAAQLDDIGGDLSRLLLQIHGPWLGDAEGTFSGVINPRAATYRVVAGGYRKAAAALKDYASALENAQHTYDSSRRLADSDASRQSVLDTHNGAYQWDPFSPDRVRARSHFEAALQGLHQATVRANAVLKTLEATIGPRRSGAKPEIFRGRGSSARQFWDELWEKGSEDARGLWELNRLWLPGEAKPAWKEKIKEYVDDKERACTDPVRYAGDEAYDYGNGEEFEAGNDARWLAGLLYNVVGGPRKLAWSLIKPDGKHKHHDKKDKEAKNEDKKTSCSPAG